MGYKLAIMPCSVTPLTPKCRTHNCLVLLVAIHLFSEPLKMWGYMSISYTQYISKRIAKKVSQLSRHAKAKNNTQTVQPH